MVAEKKRDFSRETQFRPVLALEKTVEILEDKVKVTPKSFDPDFLSALKCAIYHLNEFLKSNPRLPGL